MNARTRLLTLIVAGSGLTAAVLAVPAVWSSSLPSIHAGWLATGIGGRGTIDLLRPMGPLS